MKGSPTVSVIVPAFNAAEYVGEAIESILAQGVDDLEIIAVDDGSQDETPHILDEAAAHPLITVVHTPNRGVAQARNEGLERATGRYLTFLDADDRWRPGTLERELAIMESEPDLVAVFCNFVRFNPEGRFLPDQFTFCPEIDELEVRPTAAGGGYRILEPAFEALVTFSEVHGWLPTIMFRRAAVQDLRFRYEGDVGAEDLEYLEDMDFCLRAYRRGPVALIRDPLVEVRRHGGNLTTNYRALVLAKLMVFQKLRELDLTAAERSALDSRIAGQWISVGNWRASEGEVTEALAALWNGARGGRWLGAAKALARLPRRVWDAPRNST